jgi:hypothetical protein
VHDSQLELHAPWLASMSTGQALATTALEALPATALLFPASQTAIMSAFAMYGQVRRRRERWEAGSAVAVMTGGRLGTAPR